MKRVACLATIPQREQSLARTLGSLRKQVDALYVYLNGYARVPPIVKRLCAGYARSQRYGDRGDAGKFFWTDKLKNVLYLSCDDDFLYHDGYVAHLVRAAQRHRLRCPVSLHGVILSNRLRRGRNVNWLREGRAKLLQVIDTVPVDTRVHLVGTGVLCYHTDSLRLTPRSFPTPNVADIWFAKACRDQRIARYVVAHPPKLAVSIAPPFAAGPQHKRRSGEYSKIIARNAPWERL